MRTSLYIATLALAASASFSPAYAQSSVYTAGDLLSPCQEADNDARWGEAAETECEQYIMGFIGALEATETIQDTGICLPDQNVADEVRWSFMRWVHESYSARKALPASSALLASLKDGFACK